MDVPLYTDAKVSPAGKVNNADLGRWGKNLLVFLTPLLLVYFLQLQGQLADGSLGWGDLFPTQVTMGALQLYVVNGVLDFLRKLTDSKK